MENIFGFAHGGALFALIDEAFETASNSHGTMAVALNMNITYIAPPSPDSRLTAEAREFNRTNRTAVYDIKVTDDHNTLIASCQALVYRKGTPPAFPLILRAMESFGGMRLCCRQVKRWSGMMN